MPFIGGEFGLTETFAALEAGVSSTGRGSFSLFGQTGFTAGGQSLQGRASGGGDLLINASSGLELSRGFLEISLQGTLGKSVGVVEAIPGLAGLADVPGIKYFNDRAKLIGQVTPNLQLKAFFSQTAAGRLGFSGSEGELGLLLRGSLQVKVIPSVSVRGWLAGDGQITLGLPEPIARELRLAFEAGVELTIEFLFLKKKIRAVARYGCRWTPSRSVECSRDVGSEGLLASRAGTGLTLFLTDYDRFGDYARFGGVPLARRSTGRIPASVSQVEVVSNIFPGASPDIAEVGGGRLLVWEHQDTNDPVVQSTEIAFSWDGGLGWAEPALVADDTRAEISPQVAADGGGRAVAAWLRLKDPNFVDAPETAERLPEFFRQFEVVSAIFDPATRSWSPIMELTDNDFAETDLQLSGSGGRVLATWLENPDGEILATPGSPSSLKHSFWDGGFGPSRSSAARSRRNEG